MKTLSRIVRELMTRSSLRIQLVLAFASIILLCLVLAGSTFVYLLRPYQTQQALTRLAELAVPLATQVRILDNQGATAGEIASFLDEQAKNLGVRILLTGITDQAVIHDTGGTLTGSVLDFQGARRPGIGPVLEGTTDVPGEGALAIVAVVGTPIPWPAERFRRRLSFDPPEFSIALVSPQSNLGAAWLQIAPQLRAAALISVVMSVAVALLIARSISRPLASMTRASEAMARGDYNQQIDVHGSNEVARLGTAFNLMAQQVATSNRTLRDFLADVSHELRTPLTTIQGFAGAILDGTARDPESIKESARIISEDAARMHRMVEDLLYLSRIESGQLAMDEERVNLVAIVEGAVKRARRRAEGRELSVDLPRDPQYVSADPHRIEEVVDNLLTNAINHTPGGGLITVRAGSHGAECHLRVHNSGSFVPPEDRHRIFERFARGTGDGAGTGLGLAIASEIARAHGGRIEVDSSPTEGTAFTMVLPTAPTNGIAA